jgi:hypothetical protein
MPPKAHTVFIIIRTVRVSILNTESSLGATQKLPFHLDKVAISIDIHFYIATYSNYLLNC